MEPAVVHVATAEPEEFSGNRLFVCNLPFRYRDVDLMGMFANFAPVSAEIAYNERGSRGFGFVTLATVNDAEYARSCVNGIIIEARVIEVRRATMTMREKTRRAQMAASNRTGTQLQNVQNGASPTAANCLLGLAQMQMQQLQSAVMFNQQDVLQAALQRQLLQNLQSAGISVLPQASQQINAQLIQQQLQARAAAAVPLSVSGSNLFAPFGSTISAQSFVPQHVPQLANLLVQQQIQQAHIEKEQIAHLQSSVSPLSKNEAKRLLSWKLNAPATMVSNELVKAYSESVSLSLCLLNDFNSDSTNVSEALLSSDAYKEHLSCMRDERRRMSYSGTTLKDLENNKMNNVIYPQSSELSISSDMKARESTSSDVSSTSPTSSIRKRIRSDPDVAVEGLPNADESKKDQIDCCFSDCNLRDGESNPCKGGLDVNHNEPSGKRVKTD